MQHETGHGNCRGLVRGTLCKIKMSNFTILPYLPFASSFPTFVKCVLSGQLLAFFKRNEIKFWSTSTGAKLGAQ